jgi:multidrug efflux pump subunit AcrA (membrane-fusion protein)
VSGKIEQLLVVPGQQVKAGETLATIDAREVQARYDQAVALRQQADADLKRLTSLFEQKILSQAEFDSAQAKARIAVAGVTEAETMLGYTKVTAPFAGVITRKHADVGDLAAPGKPLLGNGRFHRAPSRSRCARSRRGQTEFGRQTFPFGSRRWKRNLMASSAKLRPPPIRPAARFS